MKSSIIHKAIYLLFLFLSVFAIQVQLLGQTDSSHLQVSEIINVAISEYGPDDLLEKGLLYFPTHNKAKNHPYLTDNQWDASTFSLLGQTYPDLEIKYDVSSDQLILKKAVIGTDVNIPILVDNQLIDTFWLQEYQFTNLQRVDSTGKLSGFAQILYKGKFIFYQTFTKVFVNEYSHLKPYGYYSKLFANYYIYQDEKLTRINNKKSLLSYFKPIQKPLKKQLRKDNFKFKRASKKEFYDIMNYCEKLLSELPD